LRGRKHTGGGGRCWKNTFHDRIFFTGGNVGYGIQVVVACRSKNFTGGDSFHGGGVVFFGGEETFLKPLGLIILTENCEIYRPLLHLTPSWRDPSEFHKDSILV